MKFSTSIYSLCLLLLALLLPLNSVALDVPALEGYVNDRAGIISAPTKLKLENFLRSFEGTDSTQLVVLTIDSLQGESLADYSLRVAESWKIGQKGKDNGALLLVAKAEHKIRIEVGYGLEGRLTDLLAGRIIDKEMTPYFKQGDFDAGILAGVAAMTQAVRGEYQGNGQTGQKKKHNSWGALALLLFLGPGMLLFGGGRHGRRRSSGIFFGGPFTGGGGGGFSGGGGGFGGGGSSGSW